MGYNAVLVVLNDRLDEIERDPEFGKKVAAAISSFSRTRPERMPYITGQTQVVSVEHADIMQVVAVGGNCGRVLGYGYCTNDDAELIKHVRAQQKRKAAKEGDQ